MAGDWCPIGPLNLHTWNEVRTECIWCRRDARTCWRSECRNGCYYPDCCSEHKSSTNEE